MLGGGIPCPEQSLKGYRAPSLWFLLYYIIPSGCVHCLIPGTSRPPHLPSPASYPLNFSSPSLSSSPFLLARLLLDYGDHSLLIPPPLGNPQSWPLYCLQTEVQSSLCHDILYDRILAHVDVGLHLFQPKLLNSFYQRGVLSVPFLQSLGLIYLDPLRNPVVETPQQPPNAQGHDPRLCAEEQVGLHYSEVKTPRHPSVRALPNQYS